MESLEARQRMMCRTQDVDRLDGMNYIEIFAEAIGSLS